MRHRMLRFFLIFLFSISTCVAFEQMVIAQTATEAVIESEAVAADLVDVPTSLDGVQALLDKGYELERARQWAEALTHYEKAARQFPKQRELRQRLILSRIHYDLSRRYSDQNFVTSTRTMDERKALDLFAEVLEKIQAHYVDTPDWSAIVRRGTTHLEVAVGDVEFRKAHLPRANREKILAFRESVRSLMTQQPIRGRRDAVDAIQAAALRARNELQIPPAATVLEYVCGAAGGLDDYSTYLTGGQLDEIYTQIEGNFVGLGIEIKADGGVLLIADVIKGGPASVSGIKPRERIIEIDGFATREMSTEAAADLLKGEEGSVVQVAIESADRQSVRRLRVQRARVEVPSVEDIKIIDEESGIAYLKLTTFQKTTSRDIDEALWKLHRNGMRSLIIDVRGNPGGLLAESVEVADKFVMDGKIVSTRGRSPREDYDYPAHRVGTWRVPLVVLIDEDSASASEIFAGAIRDHRRGTVVGHRKLRQRFGTRNLPTSDRECWDSSDDGEILLAQRNSD